MRISCRLTVSYYNHITNNERDVRQLSVIHHVGLIDLSVCISTFAEENFEKAQVSYP